MIKLIILFGVIGIIIAIIHYYIVYKDMEEQTENDKVAAQILNPIFGTLIYGALILTVIGIVAFIFVAIIIYLLFKSLLSKSKSSPLPSSSINRRF